MMEINHLLSTRTSTMQASAIREILKIVSQPGMISLAGGIPAPQSFPMEIIRELSNLVITKYADVAFQYGLTEGFIPLREALAEYLTGKGIQVGPGNLCISTGSQGALDALGKIFISKGDKIAVEAPTYLGALQAFNPYEPEYLRIDMDDEGVLPDSLEQILKGHRVKFVYLVPTFQNPTGRTIGLERRQRIADLAREYEVLIIEDDPYSVLRYRGEEIPSIKSLAPENTVYLGTLSKVFAPGLRIGFYVAPMPVQDWLVKSKQGVDLHTSSFNQALAAEYISGGYMNRHLPKILSLYRPRQEAMLTAMDDYFPDSFKWSKPEGGMFIWAEGPAGTDMDEISKKTVARNTAFVPGRYFFSHPCEGLETMRLNYTMTDEKTIRKAIKTISEVIKAEL